MKNYAIIFGKDPEEIEGTNWPDRFEETIAFEEKYVAGKFETDSTDLFWRMFLNTRLIPCSMWYWVFLNGEQVVSGAIDPDDIEYIAEYETVPEWVLEEMDRMDNSFNSDSYGTA